MVAAKRCRCLRPARGFLPVHANGLPGTFQLGLRSRKKPTTRAAGTTLLLRNNYAAKCSTQRQLVSPKSSQWQNAGWASARAASVMIVVRHAYSMI